MFLSVFTLPLVADLSKRRIDPPFASLGLLPLKKGEAEESKKKKRKKEKRKRKSGADGVVGGRTVVGETGIGCGVWDRKGEREREGERVVGRANERVRK